MKGIILIAALLSFNGYGQNTGLFGKKTVIEFSGHGAFPIVKAIFSTNEINKTTTGGNLTKSNNFFDGGFHFGLSRAFGHKFGMGVELNMNYMEFQPRQGTLATFVDDNGSTFTEEISSKYENIDFSTRTILFKFEFSGRDNLLPIGISHHIGVGFSTSKLIDKDYVEKYSFYNQQSQYTLVSVHDLQTKYRFNRKYNGTMFMYKLNFRTPVSTRLLLNYGMRLTLNLTSDRYAASDVRRNIRNQRIRSIAQLYLGLSFAF